jgi:oligopeptide/dipeptide ABC transporter ATP-binding protein
VEKGAASELNAVRGTPPDLTDLPAGCPFAPRCDFVIDKCRTENPALMPMGKANHQAACWVDITKSEQT